MPLHFHSLAEYRTPLYLYTAVPTVALFGISPLGVRLPAAIFGILGVWVLYLMVKELFKNENLALISSFVLAISPWHIQYSRAAFEVTQLLFFLLLGILLFFKSLKKSSLLWLSVSSFLLMPWVYSSAKLFTPFLLASLFIFYFKKIIAFPKKHLIRAAIAGIVIGGPLIINILFGGGAQRFGYIGVFTNPSTEHEVGVARLNDAKMRGESGTGISPRIDDRFLHNKYVFWAENIISNYLQAFSTDFLFIKGDPNPRHSIIGMGQLYRVEILALALGIIYFFSSRENRKLKLLIAFWILAGVIPSSITRDGGNHATRLILILPPLIFLVSYGIYKMNKLLLVIYFLLLLINFLFYQHKFWIHNPWQSERWWHSGYKEAITYIKENQQNYDNIVISTAGEPPWIFFAAHYQYPPQKWHSEFPIGNDVTLEGFGKISHTGKFYFGSPQVDGLYSWGQVIDNKTLYLATEKEVNVNLILEPNRTPPDLVLLKSIPFPSGEPALYIFTGK